jgi:hypothetical protein
MGELGGTVGVDCDFEFCVWLWWFESLLNCEIGRRSGMVWIAEDTRILGSVYCYEVHE